MNRWIIGLVLLAMTAPAEAAPLAADMSTYHIAMDAHFSGAKIFLFGAREAKGDIVVVVRGPAKDYVMRKKESLGGVWVNSGRFKFFDIPAYYATAASRPLEEIQAAGVFKQAGIGEANLLTPPSNPKKRAAFAEYAEAFLDHQRRGKRYAEASGPVEFVGDTLFKTVLEFPASLPPGEYAAEIYLIRSGALIAKKTLPFTVVKTGLDAWLYDLAHRSPALYGLAAVALALGAGWAAGRIFERI